MRRLSEAPEGSRVTVIKIEASREWIDQLASIGVRVGSELIVEMNKKGYPLSPVIVTIGGVKAAIDRRVARKVYVEDVNSWDNSGGR